MDDGASRIEEERRLLADARARGPAATLQAFVKLSGPGWLQSAITLGGGSLAGSLYVGVIAGYQFLWLQPFMMVLGILMLGVIAYVTLSTGERPFVAINRHVNPVLGWGWLIAAMMANMVWAMPQFSLGVAALEQNLFPRVFGGKAGPALAAGALFASGALVVLAYERGGRGVRFFEWVLKAMVAVVVVSFFGVVAAMTLKGSLPWGGILAGFVPDLSLLWSPADGLRPLIEASSAPDYWRSLILGSQQQRMIAAAATAVGINMTFLLPYSMLKKGWGREFRGLAVFDLSTGLFIPFVLATSCVVIAAAAQFHGKFDDALVSAPPSQASGSYRRNLEDRVRAELGAPAWTSMDAAARGAALDRLPRADRELAATLVSRDSLDLARSLEGLTGPTVAHVVFGIGVLGMAVSTIIILMLINGFCLTEAFGRPPGGRLHLAGAMLPGLSGALGFLFLWGSAEARFWLAVPTSNFGMILLPVAYVTFFFMINNRGLMGDQMPSGGRRAALNLAMGAAIGVAAVGSAISIWNARERIPGTDLETRWALLAVVGLFVVAVAVGFFARRSRPA